MLAYAAVAAGDVRKGILITVGVALAGMAFGRIVSAVIDDRTAFYPNWFYCLVEIIAAAAALRFGALTVAQRCRTQRLRAQSPLQSPASSHSTQTDAVGAAAVSIPVTEHSDSGISGVPLTQLILTL